MLRFRFAIAVAAALVPTLAAQAAEDDAIKKDRQLYAGTWQAVSAVVDGSKVSEAEAKIIVVINKENGDWTLEIGDTVSMRGTSKIDPTKRPKTIDLTVTEQEGKAVNGERLLGIYEVEKDARRVCIADEGKERPKQFESKPGSGHTLVMFKRLKK